MNRASSCQEDYGGVQRCKAVHGCEELSPAGSTTMMVPAGTMPLPERQRSEGRLDILKHGDPKGAGAEAQVL